MPRPSSDAVSRGAALSAERARAGSARGFDDEEQEWKPLTRDEAEALRLHEPPLSPWRVVASQVAVGILAAAIAAVASGRTGAASALYGAAVVALPAALVARGATSRLTSLSPAVSAVSMLGWGVVKMMLAVAMLAAAARIVPGLSWPVMLVTMVVCMQTYGFALLWRGSAE